MSDVKLCEALLHRPILPLSPVIHHDRGPQRGVVHSALHLLTLPHTTTCAPGLVWSSTPRVVKGGKTGLFTVALILIDTERAHCGLRSSVGGGVVS